MKKNLLIIHLESLNNLNYCMNSEFFPTIKQFEKACVSFVNYYSTATSTLMVIGDLLYGGMEQYESCKTLNDEPIEYLYKKSLFDDLKEEGYNTGIFVFPDGGDRAGAEKRHLAGFNHHMELIRDYGDYLSTIKSTMRQGPFAIMACNYISNLSLNHNIDITNYEIDDDFWSIGFRTMDKQCSDLLEILKAEDLLENTVVILYGDHGDDYWGHGMHQGLAHAIEPNALLIHTPMFIWTGQDSPRLDNRLIQTEDLKSLICDLVNGEKISDKIFRRYAYSRNSYAAQPLRKDSFNKAYSITDGRYLMCLSALGLELYDCKMDPANTNNLMRYYTFNDGVLREKVDIVATLGFHFSEYWRPREKRIIRQKFYELYGELIQKIKALYSAGGLSEEVMREELQLSE